MRVTRSLYESLQSHEAVHAEIAAIERAIKLAGRSRMEADAEAHAVAGLLRAGIGTVLRERHRPGVVLSPNAEEGLANYLNGAVAGQSTVEIGSPHQVTFVFGHTHKPFVEQRTVPAFASPVDVVNTGGWVVDTPSLDPIKGASLVLIDEQLNVASVRCYTEGADASSYRVRIDPSGPEGPNPLVDALRASIDPDCDPWAGLARTIRAAVADRGRQLADRLQADATTLDKLNQQDEPDQK
jgi:hypothetical protein